MSLTAQKPEHTGRIAVIDGDPLVYRIGFANEKKIYHYDGQEFEGKRQLTHHNPDIEEDEYVVEVRVEPVSHLKNSINLVMQAILDETEADDYVVYLGGPENYRKAVAVSHKYKGNRDKVHKPHYYDEARAYLVERHSARITDGIEADDAVAIHHLEAEDSVLCTIDKDLDMIEGWHYNYAKALMYHVDGLTARLCFFSQMLSGDSSDNIVGIRGVGKKKADKFLTDAVTEPEMIRVVVPHYVKEFGDKAYDRYVENAQLLWMMREEDVMWWPCEYTQELFKEAMNGEEDTTI